MRLLITYGGTKEPIDDVRYIANTSTGALGAVITDFFLEKGCDVVCFRSFDSVSPSFWKGNLEGKRLTQKKFASCCELFSLLKTVSSVLAFDYIVHLAAVSDYYVEKAVHYEKTIAGQKDMRDIYKGKLPSSIDDLALILKRTPKIISFLHSLFPNAKIVGFKLQSNVDFETLQKSALQLLKENHLDFVVANDKTKIDNARNLHQAFLFSEKGLIEEYQNNNEIAKGLFQALNA